MIHILKASAGAGKTYRLVRKYIEFLFSKVAGETYVDRYKYRHILAVTFTNKATQEMKERILKELDILASYSSTQNSPYYKFLLVNWELEQKCLKTKLIADDAQVDVEFNKVSEKEQEAVKSQIRNLAQHMLYGILHDYSAFSVSTIDKFFQLALRAFAREVGYYSSYDLALENDELVEESVDNVLRLVSEKAGNASLLKWLLHDAWEQVEAGKTPKLKQGLINTSVQLKSSAFQEALKNIKNFQEMHNVPEERRIEVKNAGGVQYPAIYDKKNLDSLNDALQKDIIDVFDAKLKQIYKNILNVFKTVPLIDLKTGQPLEFEHKLLYRSFLKKPMTNLSSYVVDGQSFKLEDILTDSLLGKIDDVESWFSKKNLTSLEVHDFYDALSPHLEELRDLLSAEGEYSRGNLKKNISYVDYLTAKKVLAKIYDLGIAGELFEAFGKVLEDRNVLSIDDSNEILQKIIDGSDAPFIYEKLGVRYDNFLLDEFQDTSSLQWENFAPLISESVSSGHSNLIVGDVKQSIYRFRGSDWRLLASDAQKDLLTKWHLSPNQINVESLGYNFRTTKNIVDFNNALFEFCAAATDYSLQWEEIIDWNDKYIQEIYGGTNNFKQKVPAKKTREEAYKGVVNASFVKEYTIPAKLADDGETVLQPEKQVNYSTAVNEAILASIREIQASGADLKDIAILVRGGREGAKIAQFLIENGVGVVSQDSLIANACLNVRRLVSMMYVVNNENKENKRKNENATQVNAGHSSYLNLNYYLCEDLGIDMTGVDEYHSLSDLLERLIRKLIEANVPEKGACQDRIDADAIYIQTFADCIKDWSSKNGNDLSGFLTYWEAKKNKINITLPNGKSALTIMTIHKSKGLEFDYVILPYAENIEFYAHGLKANTNWLAPKVNETPLEDKCEGIFPVKMSSDLTSTYFKDDYVEDMKLQYVDNINTFYVAMTRPVNGLYIIAENKSKEGDLLNQFKANKKINDKYSPKNFGEVLYWYLMMLRDQDIPRCIIKDENGEAQEVSCDFAHNFEMNLEMEKEQVSFRFGNLPQKSKSSQKVNDSTSEVAQNDVVLNIGYPSFAINSETIDEDIDDVNGVNGVDGVDDDTIHKVCVAGRLKFSADSLDYFVGESQEGIVASEIRKGNIKHKIMSDIDLPEDIESAVRAAYLMGNIEENQVKEMEQFINSKIASVKQRGWFSQPRAKVLSEIAIIDNDGANYRPDRVVVKEDGSVDVIDYKFGEREAKYKKQVSRYASLYKRMGYENVHGYLWYMNDKNGEDILQVI